MPADSSDDDRTTWWNDAYRDNEKLPWDTDRPQPAIVERSESGDITGRVLDVGCGIGTESRYLAWQGHEVVGVDFSEVAIERARDRADEHDAGSKLTFRVADALALSGAALGTFGTVIDCGMLHTLEAPDRRAYADSLSAVVALGGRVVLVEFGADAPDDWGPNPLSAEDVREAFDEGWRIEAIEESTFETRGGTVPALLAMVERE